MPGIGIRILQRCLFGHLAVRGGPRVRRHLWGPHDDIGDGRIPAVPCSDSEATRRAAGTSAVWLDALTNGMGPREAAENWDLPQEACEEIFAYCETNKALIEAEANEERQRLNRENLEVEARA